MRKNITRLMLCCFAIMLLVSCRKDLKSPKWETDVLAPLAKTNLSIKNLVNDSLYQINGDESVSLVYRNNISTKLLDSLAKLDVKPFSETYTLENLALNEETISEDFSLGEVAAQAPFPYNVVIPAAHGTTASLPGLPGQSAGPFAVDATSFIQEADVVSGTIILQIENGFPADIANVVFELRNTSDGSLVLNENIPLIQANSVYTNTIFVNNIVIEGNMEVNLANFDIVATPAPVTVDTSDRIKVDITIKDLILNSATALFPNQEIFNVQEETELDNMGDVELVYGIIESGTARLDVTSTIQDTLFALYKIPGATLNGVPFETLLKMPPASPGMPSTKTFYFSFDGYEFDFTGPNQDTFNLFYNEVSGRIDSTGNLVTLSLDDSLTIDLNVIDFEPEYVRGYLGQETYSFGQETIALDIFNRVIGGMADFEDAKINIHVENGIGAEGQVIINSISSINTNPGQTGTANLNTSMLNNIVIPQATDNPFTPALYDYSISEANSNPTDILEVFPNQLYYDLSVMTNPNGNDGLHDDFAYSSNVINGSIDIELPLWFSTNDLTLVDSIELQAGNVGEIDQVESGEFNLLVDNMFPIDAEIELDFVDEMGNVVEQLTSSDVILAGSVNSNGRVETAQRSKVTYTVDAAKAETMVNAFKVVPRVKLNTIPAGQNLKIYDDYNMGITLTVRFNYKID